jgi:hypothetical protein
MLFHGRKERISIGFDLALNETPASLPRNITPGALLESAHKTRQFRDLRTNDLGQRLSLRGSVQDRWYTSTVQRRAAV